MVSAIRPLRAMRPGIATDRGGAQAVQGCGLEGAQVSLHFDDIGQCLDADGAMVSPNPSELPTGPSCKPSPRGSHCP
jgi:hypothetical protein